MADDTIKVDQNIDFTQKKYDNLNLDKDSKEIPFKHHQIGQPRDIKTYDFDKIKSFKN